MRVSERTSLLSSIIAAFCIVVYIAAIAFGAVEIAANIRERQNRAEEEFSVLADRASSSAVFLGFMSESYQETIRDFLDSSKIPLLGVIVTGPNGEYAFERETGKGIVWAGNSPRFKTGFGYPREPFQKPLRLEGQRNVNVRAVYSWIDYDYFLGVFRNTLLAVLAALAIALLTLLVELVGGKKKNAPAAFSETEAKPAAAPVRKSGERDSVEIIRRPDFGAVTAIDAEAGADTFPSSAEFPKEIFGEPDIPFSPDNNGVFFQEPEESGDIDIDESDFSDDKISPDMEKDEHPEGLYTPRANIGWESYTRDRLASELHRCASSEQDLAFLVMEFPEKNNDDLYRRFADEAVEFFSMRDMIFEKGDRGISVIIPGNDLEQAMNRAEKFLGRAAANLPEAFESRTELRVGLSSRAGRLIDADRLMLEAGTALEKAHEDPVSPVVAFKSDPDKYREFIKNHLKE